MRRGKSVEYVLLSLAMAWAKVSFPRPQEAFHLFCHNSGTCMTHFCGLDTYGLVQTRRWKDPSSADRYNHTMATPETRRADLLPVVAPSRRGKAVYAR